MLDGINDMTKAKMLDWLLGTRSCFFVASPCKDVCRVLAHGSFVEMYTSDGYYVMQLNMSDVLCYAQPFRKGFGECTYYRSKDLSANDEIKAKAQCLDAMTSKWKSRHSSIWHNGQPILPLDMSEEELKVKFDLQGA